jgi:hypothetical protein
MRKIVQGAAFFGQICQKNAEKHAGGAGIDTVKR